MRVVDAGGLLRDGLHDALLGRLLVLVDELVNRFQIGDADLALLGVGFGLGRLGGGEQRQAQQRPSQHGGWVASHLFDASVWATLAAQSGRSVSQQAEK